MVNNKTTFLSVLQQGDNRWLKQSVSGVLNDKITDNITLISNTSGALQSQIDDLETASGLYDTEITDLQTASGDIKNIIADTSGYLQ